MPANRVAPLVDREALGGAYFLLTFRHPEIAREARAGPVRDDQGRRLGRAAAAPAVLDPRRWTRRAETLHPVREGDRPGLAALCARCAPGDVAQCLGPLGRPFTPPPAGDRGAARRRRLRRRARSASWARSCARAGGRARLFYGGRTAADLPLLDRLAEARARRRAGDRGRQPRRARPRHRPARGAPRRGRRAPVRLYACGPDAMMHAVARIAAARGARRPR